MYNSYILLLTYWKTQDPYDPKLGWPSHTFDWYSFGLALFGFPKPRQIKSPVQRRLQPVVTGKRLSTCCAGVTFCFGNSCLKLGNWHETFSVCVCNVKNLLHCVVSVAYPNKHQLWFAEEQVLVVVKMNKQIYWTLYLQGHRLKEN